MFKNNLSFTFAFFTALNSLAEMIGSKLSILKANFLVFKNNYGLGSLCLACYVVYKSISSMQAYIMVTFMVFVNVDL